MESQPQNPEFRNYSENFHPWVNKVIKFMTKSITGPAHAILLFIAYA